MTDNAYLSMDLLRFTTAGSVDDGKSTLIGRLLYDSKSIFEDQMEAIEISSRNTGEEGVNLALLTDGLRAEREQKITIDVAYRYFATPRRKFIIADTPGHIQYTRNVVTGASTADLAIILVDARKGVLTQSKRHSFIASLLQIPHVVVAINKMDLVDFSQERFDEIVSDYSEFAQKLEIDDITYIPISALLGDNIVNKSENMPWYGGTTLLHHLEHVNMGSRRNLIDFRFPVQYVIRPGHDFRGYAGTVASGALKVGEEVMALPSRYTSRVASIVTHEGNLQKAFAGDSITITLEDEIDISRGDMLVRMKNLPDIKREFEAVLCWMNEEPMQTGKHYLLMHTTRTVRAIPVQLHHKIDVNTLHREEAGELKLNEIGRVRIQTANAIFFDTYKLNNATGSFILIDPGTNVTVGAGMIRGISSVSTETGDYVQRPVSPDVVWEPWNIPLKEREALNGHKAAVFWFTGLSGSGKTTIGRSFERKLFDSGCRTMLIDGDQVRHGLNGDLGFSEMDRAENIRRVAHVSRLFYEHGNIVICTFISPYQRDRDFARSLFPPGSFFEVFVDCPLEEAERRDVKGLYAKARRGEIVDFTGIDSPYEKPENPEIIIPSDSMSTEDAVTHLMNTIKG